MVFSIMGIIIGIVALVLSINGAVKVDAEPTPWIDQVSTKCEEEWDHETQIIVRKCKVYERQTYFEY